MNLKELCERFDAFVDAVKERIIAGRQDPGAVLDVRRAELKLRAMTLPPPSATYHVVSMREPLQTSATIDELADEFIANWRAQTRRDDSL